MANTSLVAALILLQFFLAGVGHCDYRKGLSLYQRGDFDGALREFRAAAESRRFDGYEAVILDMALSRSDNTAPSGTSAEMLRLIGVAAEDGTPEIQWQLSRLWAAWGQQVDTRSEDRLRWLVRAASAGYAEAAWELWNRRPSGYVNKDRIPWLRRAAELGHAEAQRDIIQPLRPFFSFDEKLHWAKVRAAARDPLGFAYLGELYAGAPPGRRDYQEAVKWLRRAWQAGFRRLPVPQTLVRLYDNKLISDATEEEIAMWRDAARVRVIH